MNSELTPREKLEQESGLSPESRSATRRKLSFVATMRAVFWSFFGVRKKSAYEQDAAQLNPIHVIIAGIIGALIFIGVLLMIVKAVVANQ